MVRTLLALSLAALCSACGPASLSEFSTAQLSLEEQVDGRIVVELPGAHGRCATLRGEAKATLNGRAMDLDFAGGEVDNGQGWTCRPPRFSLAAAEAGDLSEADARVVVEDSTARLVLEAGNVFAQRGLVPTRFDEDDSQMGRKSLAFRWIPQTDANRTASWRLVGHAGEAHFGEARVDSDVVLVELPEQAAERATLRMDGRASAPVLRCEGVASCSALVRASSGELEL